jgi:tetratricopeptide (TPR) repeat protein
MMKNEIDTVPTTMHALARVGIPMMIAFDTGSTDGTQALMRKLAVKLNLTLDLIEGEFVDFATSRNVLLEHSKFKSHWLLLMDAGEDIIWEGSVAEHITAAAPSVGSFRVPIILYPSATTFMSPRIVRNIGVWKYEFPVHEYLVLPKGYTANAWPRKEPGARDVPQFALTHDRTLTGRSSPARWVRDAKVLENFLVTQPNNTRALFYLANTYSNMGQDEKALEWYIKRYSIRMRGWWEERELSAVSIVKALENLGRYDEWRSWSLMLLTEHKRIEGVMALARRALDVDNNPMECVLWAELATKVPNIERDLWYEPKEYTTYRHNMLTLCRHRWREERLQNGTMIATDNDFDYEGATVL